MIQKKPKGLAIVHHLVRMSGLKRRSCLTPSFQVEDFANPALSNDCQRQVE